MKKLLSRLLILALSLEIFSLLNLPSVYAVSANLYLSPANLSVNLNSEFTIAVRADVNGGQTNAVQANLSYPTALLQFVSIDTITSAFDIQAENTGGSGSVKIARGILTPKTGDQLVANVTFKGISTGAANVSFASGSNVVDGGSAIPLTTTPGTYTVTSTQEGNWVNKIVINLSLPDVLQGNLISKVSIIGESPEYSVDLKPGTTSVTLTIPDGVFAVSSLTKKLKLATEKSLTRVVDFIPNAKELTINVGSIKLGDINSDNAINSIDYSILISSYMPKNDTKADLNLDTVVNSIDYSMMLANFSGVGD